jgi:hypothetical protein
MPSEDVAHRTPPAPKTEEDLRRGLVTEVANMAVDLAELFRLLDEGNPDLKMGLKEADRAQWAERLAEIRQCAARIRILHLAP